jgi:hypothetical protein
VIIVKRFDRNGARYSIRCRPDGTFQVWHDNPYAGIGQGYDDEDEPISGIFASSEMAETELLRIRPDVRPLP